jgi:4-amino-4-deoxy-L-arabinose transferase-like glycosyltransferase
VLPAVLLIAGILALGFLAVSSVRHDSATADEAAHIAAGLIKLRHGWLSFYPEQPPLMNVITALALRDTTLPGSWRGEKSPEAHWRVGHTVLYGAGNDARNVLLRARLPTIALFIALCCAVYAFVTRETGSRWFGLLGFVLTGLCPNLLAHGRLATTDLAVTAFSFGAVVLFLRALQNGSWVVGAAAGAMSAAALLSKTSGALAVAFCMLLALVHLVRSRSRRAPLVAGLAFAVAGLAVVEAVYLTLAGAEWMAFRHPGVPRLVMPIREYALNVMKIHEWYAGGHERPQFLLGEFSATGWPHYFLVAFLLKTPLAGVLMFIAAAVAAAGRGSAGLRASVAFVLLFLAVSATSHVNLGIRYVLPVYPFVHAAIAMAASQVRRAARRPTLTASVLAVLVLWFGASSLAAYPGYISYFNELIGSQRNADRFLIDSNLDWGQDLHRLKLWADANGIDFLRIDYFGAGDIGYEFGDEGERWTAPRPQPIPPGWFALSRHFYRISFDPAVSPVNYDDYLAASKAEYVTTVGGSIDVYRVRGGRQRSTGIHSAP